VAESRLERMQGPAGGGLSRINASKPTYSHRGRRPAFLDATTRHRELPDGMMRQMYADMLFGLMSLVTSRMADPRRPVR